MKRILFIGPSNFNFKNEASIEHLREKYQGLAQSAEVFVLAVGAPFHIKKWHCDFYLLPNKLCFLIFGLKVASLICLSKKIDTIICQSPLLEGYFGSILAKWFKKALIVEMHGDPMAIFLTKKRRLEKLQKKIVNYFIKKSLQRADKVRVVAQYLADKAGLSAPKAKYYNFPTYTNLSLFFKEKNTAFEKYILFVGVLYKIKGVEYLIEAFSRIAPSFPDFKLKIIGEGPEKENLENMVKDFGMSDRVEFLGKLSLERTKDVMKNCYLLCLPSLSEGLPRVIMEAMALKKPVVASNVGGMAELVKNNETGFLFEKQNVNDLAGKIAMLLKDNELALELGKKGGVISQNNFSIEKYLQNYQAMINE